MRVLVMIKGDGADEDKIAPTDEMFAAMNAYNEQLVNAGIMLDGDGLKPSGRRQGRLGGRRDLGGRRPVHGGEGDHRGLLDLGGHLAGGGVEWAKRCPTTQRHGASVLEIRPFFEMEDFGEEFSPELQEQENKLSRAHAEQHG